LPALQLFVLHCSLAVQLPMQAAAPLQKVAPHSDAGSVLTAMGRQVPGPAARLHAWHVPSQAPLQHTPSAQKPDWHSLAASHSEAAGCFGSQVPAWQNAPGLQSASTPHSPMQAALPLHSDRPHSPAASVRAATGVQVPSAEAPSPAAHTSHVPLQAPSQQTPSVQVPERHWLDAVQPVPRWSFGAQLPALQKLPALH
jgi:hypothetical protein